MSVETARTNPETSADPRPPTPSAADDEHRRRLHGMWAAVAPSWEHHADCVDARAEAITGELLAAAALRPGDRALELACGPGVWGWPRPRWSAGRARSWSRMSCRR